MFIPFYYEFFIKLTLFFSIQSPYFYGYSVTIKFNIYYICLAKIKVLNAIARPYRKKQLWAQSPELVFNILKINFGARTAGAWDFTDSITQCRNNEFNQVFSTI